jgi:hypothetical protein
MTIVSLKSRQRSPNLPSGITEKMYRFAEGVADGLSAADAYRAAFNTSNMLPKTVRDEASRLLKNRGVSTALEALRAEKTHQQRVSRQKSEDRVWEHLWGLVDGVETPPGVKVRALTLAAELAGMMGGVSNQEEGPSTVEELEAELLSKLSRHLSTDRHASCTTACSFTIDAGYGVSACSVKPSEAIWSNIQSASSEAKINT